MRWLAFTAILCSLLASGWTLTHSNHSPKGYSLAEVQAGAVASADLSNDANMTYVAVKYPRVRGVETLANGTMRVELSIWIYGRSAPQGADHHVTVEVSPNMQIVKAHEAPDSNPHPRSPDR
jgi:hypothetical protein